MAKGIAIVILAVLGAYLFAQAFTIIVWPIADYIPRKGATSVWVVHSVLTFILVLLQTSIFGRIGGAFTSFPVIPLGLAMGLLTILPDVVAWFSIAQGSIGLNPSNAFHVMLFSQWALILVFFVVFVHLGRSRAARNS